MTRPRISTNYAIALVAIVGVLTCGLNATAQDAPRKNAKPSIDARELVESLVSKNKPLKRVGDTRVDAPAGFVWAEQVRSRSAINGLVDHAEDAWPELVAHLEDDRYCVTVSSLTGYVYNWTVGDVCDVIISRNLSEAYYAEITPESREFYGRFRSARVAGNRKQLKAWCEKRSKLKLYELQIEACAWASRQLEMDDFRASSKTRKEWIELIDAKAKLLAKTKTAVPYPGFGPEEFELISEPKKGGEDPFADPPIDARKLVESLASANTPPKIIGPRARPTDEFNWDEQRRTWDVFKELVKHAEEAWPELVAHLEDERYCVTFTDPTGQDQHWTVADACDEIISDNLSQAYFQELTPQSRELHTQLRRPGVGSDRKQFKEWCEKRSEKKLYELQIEACEWAAKKLATEDGFQRTSSETRKKWIEIVEAKAKTLAETKTAVTFRGFGDAISPIRERKFVRE